MVTNAEDSAKNMLEEKDLISLEEKARSGDALAFGEVLQSLDHSLRGVVWSIVRQSHVVDDIMQSSYEKAFRSIKAFKGNSTMKTWLHSICYKTAIDHVRYENRRRHGQIDAIKNQADTVSTSEQALAKVSLAEALSGTEPETRALLMFTAGLGYSYEETAKITGIERGTVASRVGRAREKMRKEVES